MLSTALKNIKWRSFVLFMFMSISIVLLLLWLLGKYSILVQILSILVPNGAILTFFIWQLKGRVDVREVLLPLPKIKDLRVYVCILAFSLLTTSATASVVFQIVLMDSDNPAEFLKLGISTNNSLQFYCKVVVMVLIGPIAEELFFRGFLLEKWRKYGTKKAIIASSIIFSLAHGGLDPSKILLGTIFAIFYLKRGIAIGIYYHMFNNLFAFLIVVYSRQIHISPKFYSNVAAYWIPSVIYLIFLSITYCVALKRWRFVS